MYFLINYQPYIAIIGDIKGSKAIKNRKEVQENLAMVLNEINDHYSDDIASRFMITLGDEFQGLLLNGTSVMKIISRIEGRLDPVKLRFGIGVGEITTKINPYMAIGADGPGYHKARAAIEYLKENEKRKQSSVSDIRLEVEGENQEPQMFINTIFGLMAALKASWTKRQREIIQDMLEHRDNQTETAKRLNIKQPTVSKVLVTGNYYAYEEAFDTVEKALGEIG
ncbi:SatD family protein [Lacrimispora sp.]|uniref:SatD family protein n=1 Tax=Lacrimispora sp. TaxID=2719234 RepID=UPI0032E3F701